MIFFMWKDSFKIGVAEIDRQHREFLECLNEFYQLNAAAKDAPVSRQIVAKLKRYAEEHFKYEVSLFEGLGYKETEAHIRQHDYFVSRVRELDDEQLSGDIERLDGVLAFLRDWFLSHILQADKEFVPFIAGLGSNFKVAPNNTLPTG